MGIRNAAKAIIINEGKILVNKNCNSLGDMCYGLENGAVYYDLPGGGQNQYESLEEAVKRECLEESGYNIAVHRLAGVYEEISQNQNFRKQYEQYAHKIHFVFVCALADETLREVTEKDLDMVESLWVDIAAVQDLPLYPVLVKENIGQMVQGDNVLYLGSQKIR